MRNSWFILSTSTERKEKQGYNQKGDACVHACVASVRVANVLTGPCGLSPGDHLIVMLPKIPQWWLLNIACARAGRPITVVIIIIIVLFRKLQHS